MKKSLTIISILLVFISCDEKKNTFRDANDLYQSKAYKQAEKEYRRVLTMDSTYSKAFFNLANARYRQGDTTAMETAMNNWQKAYDLFDEKDSLAKSSVIYNQGNVKFKQAIDTSYFPPSYNYGLLKEAAEDYKKVLRQFPNDTAARYNLTLINHLLSQQPKNNKKNKQQQQDQQQQQSQNQPQQPQQPKQQQPPQSAAQQKQNKDKEDINRMLEALKNNERNTLKKLKKNEKKQPNKYQTDKDW
ncbi:MAG: hypothetical protein LBO06_08480 [Bacteroidales bacterium]|nr:hypothetical protein [Bacteroidales bacterium]